MSGCCALYSAVGMELAEVGMMEFPQRSAWKLTVKTISREI